MMTSALAPGFADPTMQAQTVFRRVLDAMAHPGRVTSLPHDLPAAPAPLDDATFALALTLLDFETPTWLDAKLATPDIVESLGFHCGCPIVEQPEAAAFNLIGDAASLLPFSAFSQGTPEYPDRAATLIIQTDGLAEDEGWTLTGPGIQHEARLRVLGLSKLFTEQVKANRLGFPNGVDMIFTHERRLAGLPRTTSLEV
ncbi:MAG: phosphonate C-P lyase system protein PhnH [Geminicoccales bacterium]